MNGYNRGYTATGSGYTATGSRQPGYDPEADAPEAKRILAVSVALILALAINFMVLAKVDLPVVRPLMGFWYVLIFPSYLLFTSSAWRRCGLQERLGYSVCSVLLILMLAGLAINEVLPLAGVQRPLEPGPIIVVSDIINISLYIFRSLNPDRAALRVDFTRFSKQEFRLLVAAALT